MDEISSIEAKAEAARRQVGHLVAFVETPLTSDSGEMMFELVTVAISRSDDTCLIELEPGGGPDNLKIRLVASYEELLGACEKPAEA